MISKLLIPLLCVSINCFSSDLPFLTKNENIPSSSKAEHTIEFRTTRSLKEGALKASLLKHLQTAFEIDTFIETGTYLGETTRKAAQVFEDVHTIELSSELFFKTSLLLKPLTNVSCHCGDSIDILKIILPNIQKRILFYLDGHYSGHVTARGSLDTPILKELQSIASCNKSDSILLIDDIRLFQNFLYPEKVQSLNLGLETYPDLKEVISEILKINSDYQICFLADALLAFPKNSSVGISPVMRACALHRLEPYCIDITEEDVKEAWQIIGNAKLKERSEIQIYYETYSPFELAYGYRSYACFWYGLTLQGSGEIDKAKIFFKLAADNGAAGLDINK